jgi:hypothetical protein
MYATHVTAIGMTAYQCFRRWSEAGIWDAVVTTVSKAMADNSRRRPDSTTVRGYVSAAGAKGGLESARHTPEKAMASCLFTFMHFRSSTRGRSLLPLDLIVFNSDTDEIF